MSIYFITRHKGAADWAKAQGIVAETIAHLNPATIEQGDTVIGTLPVHIAAEICAKGARYFHLSIDIPELARGRELSGAEMAVFGARLQHYNISEVPNE